MFRKKTYFVDLFVRVSNKRAVDMYHKLNYVVYRRIIGYYSGERDEDAFGESMTNCPDQPLRSFSFIQI